MRNVGFDVLNKPVDVSEDLGRLENIVFQAEKMLQFDGATGRGVLEYRRYARKPRMAFNQVTVPYETSEAWEFPPEYEKQLAVPFELRFVAPGTVRVRIGKPATDETSPMLCGAVPMDESWIATSSDNGVIYRSEQGSVRIQFAPWHIEFRDSAGKLLTRSWHSADRRSLLNCDPVPFSIIRRNADMQERAVASLTLSPGEKIFGLGESFTRLDKRGQKVVLYTCDAYGVGTEAMYKPVPFFLSNRGYGVFVHTATPMTVDVGCSYGELNTLVTGEGSLDLFVFIGGPKQVLEQYTALTGRSPMPPLWSFGLWMSRITYKSEEETRQVARRMRDERIPCDVIHLDTGWFEREWLCDYQFAASRFADPKKMIADLKQQGFRISLWQLPYFAPTNPLYREAIEKRYVVRGVSGGCATADAVVDFTNPDAVKWYQELLAGLLRIGVAAIKADFGEAGTLHGWYANGRGGWYEHNLYPLRYNQAVAEITEKISGESIIWARSAWAGSQRYPIHWGGDAETTDNGMLASLRGGLSLGLCGFTFWSHDIGGFTTRSPRDVYRRWMPFGMLSSHSRCHGAPPREPWEYDADFVGDFRRAVELKYRLMPYIYTEAKQSSERGHPMARPLFFEFPDDQGSWLVEDQYMLGESLLVAPLMEDTAGREVYLPPGWWCDYQTGMEYEGGRWHKIGAGAIPVIVLMRDGAAIPQAAVAQHTGGINWDAIEWRVYCREGTVAAGSLFTSSASGVQRVRFIRDGAAVRLEKSHNGSEQWSIRLSMELSC